MNRTRIPVAVAVLAVGAVAAVACAHLGLPVLYVVAVVLAALAAWIIVRTRVALVAMSIVAAVAILLPLALAGGSHTEQHGIPIRHDGLGASLTAGSVDRVGGRLVVTTDAEVRVVNAKTIRSVARIPIEPGSTPGIATNGDLIVHQHSDGREVVARYTLDGRRRWSVPRSVGKVVAASDTTAVFTSCSSTCHWTAIDRHGERAWTKKGRSLGLSSLVGVTGDRLPGQLVNAPALVQSQDRDEQDRGLRIYDVDTGRLTGTTPDGTPVVIGTYVVLLRSERALQDANAGPGSAATMIGYHDGRRIWRSADLTSVDGDDAEVVDGQLLLTTVTRESDQSLQSLARVDLQHGSLTTLDTPDGSDYVGTPEATVSGDAAVLAGEKSGSGSTAYGSGRQHDLLVAGGRFGHDRVWTRTFEPEAHVDVHPGGVVVISPAESTNPFVSRSERRDHLRLRVLDPATGQVRLDTWIANAPVATLVPAPGRLLLVGRTTTMLHY